MKERNRREELEREGGEKEKSDSSAESDDELTNDDYGVSYKFIYRAYSNIMWSLFSMHPFMHLTEIFSTVYQASYEIMLEYETPGN